MTEINEFIQRLLSLDRLKVRDMILNVESGPSVQTIERLIVPALEEIGRDWEQGKVALSQIYMCGRICEELIDSILQFNTTERQWHPKMAIASPGDHHLLGKRVVYSVLKASGFELLDYGYIESNNLIHRVKNDKIQILLLSTLMLPAALNIATIRKKLQELQFDVKIVVGGAPFRCDNELWQDVGADAMCRNASEIVGKIKQLTVEINK
jgi:methanogenic corrinoid protein MtbC1